MISLHIEAATTDELYAAILAQVGGEWLLPHFSDEDALTEVRQRFSKRGMVVKVKAFEAK
jgi:hypothetical protein